MESKIVGRGKELRIIDKLLLSEKAEFLALYGRRRVGKTFIVREYLKAHIHFAFSGSYEEKVSVQIDNFFPKNDQEVKYYYDFQSKFNSRFDEEAVIIGIKNNLGIFDQNFLRKTDSLTIALTNMPDVVKVYSLNNTTR